MTLSPKTIILTRIAKAPRTKVLLILLALASLSLLPGMDTARGADLKWDPYEYWYAVGSTDPNVVQDFTIPAGFQGRLSLQVEGADGGNSRAIFGTFAGDITAFGEGGPGARVSTAFTVGYGTYAIPSGSTLRFIVGRKGESGNEKIILGFSFPDLESQNRRGGGGGGGSAVYLKKPGTSDWIFLAGAGGGGGAYSDVVTLIPASGDGRYGRHFGDGYGDTRSGGDGGGAGGGDGGVYDSDTDTGGAGAPEPGASGGGGTGGTGQAFDFGADNWKYVRASGGGRAGPYIAAGGKRISSGTDSHVREGGSGWGGGGASITSVGAGGGGFSGGGGGGLAGGGGGGGSEASTYYRRYVSIGKRAAQSEERLPQHGVVRYDLTPNYTISPTTILKNADAGTATIQLTALVTPAVSWYASSSSWLHVSPSSGTGSATLQLSLDANPGAKRTGTVTIANQTITVTQTGEDIVVNTANSGPGSLRQVIADALPGAEIVFDSNLSGSTITLASELVLNKDLTIDASALAEGITISGGNATRIFNANNYARGWLTGLTLINGNAGGGKGGAVTGDWSTEWTLNSCTLTGNYALEGGAIFSEGFALYLNNCTLTENTGVYGGALQCTGFSSLEHCTITKNHANYGGGIFNKNTALYLENCIVAGNTASTLGPDIYNQTSTREYVGANLIQSVYNSGAVYGGGPAPINAAPRLAPLGSYGGPTQTLPPIPGSPAIDAGVNNTFEPILTDQRGLARVVGSTVDLGAVEYQGFSDMDRIWTTDWDSDGIVYGMEHAGGTDPLAANPPGTDNIAARMTNGMAGVSFGFNPNATNTTAWIVKRSMDLATDPFTEIYRYDTTRDTTSTNPVSVNVAAASIEVFDAADPQPTNAFYRLDIELIR